MGKMSRGLLDTSVVISQEDGESLAALPQEGAISVVTLAELHYGVLVAKDDETRQRRLRRLGVVEASFQPLPIDAAIGRAYATLAHTVKASGRQPRARVMDLWIAATALVHEVPLYTRNPADFEGLEELIEVLPV
jgi:predicted nucleic acid-binding protein